MTARLARAQSPAEEDEATRSARALFVEGTERARFGDWSRALEAFERSSALRRHPVTTYDIGYCERALGRMTRARKMFERALADSSKAASSERQLPGELAAAASFYLAEVDRRVARVTVRLPRPDASIQIDGRPLELSAPKTGGMTLWAGTRDLGPGEPAPPSPFIVELDAGTHVVVLTYPGRPEEITTQTVAESSGTEWTFSATFGVPPARVNATGGTVGGPSAASAWHTAKGIGLRVAVGAAGAGLATGAVAGAIALMQKAKVAGACSEDHACTTAAGAVYLSRANTAADVSTVGWAVGGVAAGAAAALWLTERSATTGLRPSVAPGAVGVAGQF